MKIVTKHLTLKTKGDGDYHNITPQVKASLEKTGLKKGNVLIFIGGSTAGLTTFEFEPGLRRDIKKLFEKLAPRTEKYQHNMKWHDGNGYAHIRSAICRPTFCIPFSEGKLLLGTWQQIVFLEFDNRPRDRKIILQFIGQ